MNQQTFEAYWNKEIDNIMNIANRMTKEEATEMLNDIKDIITLYIYKTYKEIQECHQQNKIVKLQNEIDKMQECKNKIDWFMNNNHEIIIT